nr:hypothetical protein [Burkholderia sp. WSM2230]
MSGGTASLAQAVQIGNEVETLYTNSMVRCELPAIAAFNFVLGDVLGGGVARSLALDAHGKSLSSALMALEIGAPPAD